MKKRVVILVTLLLTFGLCLVSTASADQISGAGTIWAKGVGEAIIRGDGEVEIVVHGVATVWAKNTETLEVRGRGQRWEAPGGATVLWGWSGTIYASGEHMTVWMRGGLIEFTASGTGWVYLRGHGKYETSGHKGFWRPTGEILSMENVQQAE